MNKRCLLLAGLVAVSGMTFSVEQESTENEEVCIYDDPKSDLYVGIGITAVGVAAIAARLVFGSHLGSVNKI